MSKARDDASSPASIPKGFEPLRVRSGLLELIGPIFNLQDEDVLRFGFVCERRHCNASGGMHGGMLAAYGDIILTCGAIYHGRLETGVITVSMTCDFLSPAAVGEWIEGTAELLQVTRSMAFVEADIRVGDRRVLRASGVLKLGAPAQHRWINRTASAARLVS